MKINLPAADFLDDLRDIKGNPQASSCQQWNSQQPEDPIPAVLNTKINTKAKTCADVL
jgi:hypothetical protein